MENTFNPTDKLTLDVPLFIRLLEYAREDSTADMDLHKITENALALSETGATLTMANYNTIVKATAEELQEIKRIQYIAGIRK
jgi:hypothetical protein